MRERIICTWTFVSKRKFSEMMLLLLRLGKVPGNVSNLWCLAFLMVIGKQMEWVKTRRGGGLSIRDSWSKIKDGYLQVLRSRAYNKKEIIKIKIITVTSWGGRIDYYQKVNELIQWLGSWSSGRWRKRDESSNDKTWNKYGAGEIKLLECDGDGEETGLASPDLSG